MKYLLSILCLFIFSCDSGGDDAIDCTFNNTCNFQANISLSDNNETITGADVYIMYKCNTSEIPPNFADVSWCDENSNYRPTTTISFNLMDDYTYNVLIELYDLENNLLSTIADGDYLSGFYEITMDFNELQLLPPFGVCLYILKLKTINNLGEIYEDENTLLLITAPDFEQLKNLGQTDELGLFQLTSEYKKWIPTFFDLDEFSVTDEFGTFLGNFTINDYVDGFEIIFLYEDVYKVFDINLINGENDYNFDWQDGEIFNP